MTLDQSLVGQLRRQMAERGVNQIQLAERAGMHPNVVNRILSPRGNPTARTLDRLFAALRDAGKAAE